MQKIPSLFVRDFEHDVRLVRDEVTPGCEWVLSGEGVAYRKWDGTAAAICEGKLYKRYDAKQGRTPPSGFIPAQDPDPRTKHWPGWVLVDTGRPENKYFAEAFDNGQINLPDGTYELCGPQVNGNPERLLGHVLIAHTLFPLSCPVRTFETIRSYLVPLDVEGIVWHHPDGRMSKIKKKDFGLVRCPPEPIVGVRGFQK